MFGIGPWELALIFLIILLLFGAKRLPDIARSIGRAVNEFKKGTQGGSGEQDKPDKKDQDKTA
jgi:TatA/E family protein of Tat protein translocase